jgi:hypothetical protein
MERNWICTLRWSSFVTEGGEMGAAECVNRKRD